MNWIKGPLSVFLVLLAFAAPAGAGAAAPARLDPSFGNNGVRLDARLAEGVVAVSPTGQLIVVAGSPGSFTVAGLRPDGSLDPGFGEGGIATVPLGDNGVVLPDMPKAHVSAATITPDGRIVIAGTHVFTAEMETHGRAVIVRLEPDGRLDTGFGPGAQLGYSTGIFHSFNPVSALLIQDDGIVYAGGDGRGEASRLEADGEIDRAFGRIGIPPLAPEHAYPANGYTGVVDLLGARGGSVYAVGHAKGKLMLALFGSDGSWRRWFGRAGIVRTPLPGAPRCPCTDAAGAARDARGRLLVAGTISAPAGKGRRQYPTGPRRIVLARYWPNGKLDRGFGGGDGIVYAGLGSATYASGVAVQPDGRIVVSGRTGIAHRGSNDVRVHLAVFRFLPDGRRDRGFYGDGVYEASFGATYSEATQVLVGPSGRVLVAGTAALGARYSELRGVLLRFSR